MDQIVLVLITFVAATVNGALGYGFSSITMPVALLFYTNRILNPAMVLVELVLNSYVLFLNRQNIPNIFRRVVLLRGSKTAQIFSFAYLMRKARSVSRSAVG